MTIYDAEVDSFAFTGVLLFLVFFAGGILGGLVWWIYLKTNFNKDTENATTKMVVSGIVSGLAVIAVVLIVVRLS